MKTTVQKTPDFLIYEMSEGKAIYYKGYKDYLNGIKQLDELRASSKIQAFLVSELVFL